MSILLSGEKILAHFVLTKDEGEHLEDLVAMDGAAGPMDKAGNWGDEKSSIVRLHEERLIIGHKIAKAQLKDVAEWGDSFCITLDHYDSDKRANTRKRECRQCWQALLKEVK